MKKLLALAILFVCAAAIQAADVVSETNARVDINSLGKDVALKPVSSEGGTVTNIGWGKPEDFQYSLICQSAALPENKWTKASFTFMPASDGKVTINLMGNWAQSKDQKKLDAHWVYFDMVSVTGAASPLQNGDFEDAKDGKPVGWECSEKSYLPNGVNVLSGNDMVKVWHNVRCSQTIDVKKDQPVTITVNVKKGEIEQDKE